MAAGITQTGKEAMLQQIKGLVEKVSDKAKALGGKVEQIAASIESIKKEGENTAETDSASALKTSLSQLETEELLEKKNEAVAAAEVLRLCDPVFREALEKFDSSSMVTAQTALLDAQKDKALKEKELVGVELQGTRLIVSAPYLIARCVGLSLVVVYVFIAIGYLLQRGPASELESRVNLSELGMILAFTVGLLALRKAAEPAQATTPASTFDYNGIRLNFAGSGAAFVVALSLVVVAFCATPNLGGDQGLPKILEASAESGRLTLKGTNFGAATGTVLYRTDASAWSQVKPELEWDETKVSANISVNVTGASVLLIRRNEAAASNIYDLKSQSTANTTTTPPAVNSGSASPSASATTAPAAPSAGH